MNASHEHEPPHEAPAKLTPRIRLACLAEDGPPDIWLDATEETGSLHEQIERALATTTRAEAPEWLIVDLENFAGYRVNPHDSLESVAAVARGIAEHGRAFASWAQIHHGNPDMLDGFTDAYCGSYESTADWAEQVLDQSGVGEVLAEALPEWLRRFVRFDLHAIAETLSAEVHIAELSGGGIAIFDARI